MVASALRRWWHLLALALLGQIRQSPEIRARFDKLGFEPLTSTPEEASRYLTDETQRRGKVAAAAGARIE